MSVTIAEQMQGWQRDEIVRLLEQRNVSFRAAARIVAILKDQPPPAHCLGNQTETAHHLRGWTEWWPRDKEAERERAKEIRRQKNNEPNNDQTTNHDEQHD
jgi:hypothetical protein